MRDSKQKRVALVVLIVAVIGLTVAFAALSNNLTISGNAKLDPINWDIYFDNIANIKAERKATIGSDPIIDTSDRRKIRGMSVTLTEPGDKVSFTADIVSESDIDASIDSILKEVKVKPEGAEHGFIDFNVYYTDTNVEVKKGDTIVARENGESSRTNITISVYYNKDKVTNDTLNNMPPGGLEIGFNYGLTFKQYDELVDTTTTDSGFPVLTGKLGDNVTFTYNNGELSINGYGPMYDGVISSGNYCEGYSEAGVCVLGAELAVALNNTIQTSSDNVTSAIKQYGAIFMAGQTYEILGMSESEFKDSLINSDNLTEDEANEVIKIINSIPKISKISIQNDPNSVGITSLRSGLFAYFNASNLEITLPKTLSVGVSIFGSAKIGTVKYEKGTEIVRSGTCYAVDGEINKIIIPEGVKTIESRAIYEEGGNMTTIIIPPTVTKIENNAISALGLTTIVNETGRKFDWNAIINGTPGTEFETGTVDDDGKIITITNKY